MLRNWILGRATEGSSMAGIAAIVYAVGDVIADPTNAKAWGTIVAGVLAIVIRERGSAN